MPIEISVVTYDNYATLGVVSFHSVIPFENDKTHIGKLSKSIIEPDTSFILMINSP